MTAQLEFYRYTAAEFLQLDLDESLEYELRDGIITPMAEPSGQHENLRSELLVELRLESRRADLGFLVHPKPVLALGPRDTRKPDLIVVDKEVWRRQTEAEAVLREPPSIVIEVVSTNWEDDYRNKPLWYAAFGITEYWIIDPLYHLERYPGRKNPKIQAPTISVGNLVSSSSILIEKEYQFKSFTGSDRIASQFFPELALRVDQIIALGQG